MDEPAALLRQCQEALSQRLMDKASSLAQQRQTKDLHDPALHLAWADLLEELGLVEEVVLELNLAIRDEPERQETYARLGEIYLDQGKPLQAAHLWGQLVKRKPQAARAYRELGRALEEAQEFDKARQVYQLALEKTGEPHFQTLLKHLGFLEDTPEAPETPPAAEQLLPQPHHLVTFLGLFGGREGVYARQWVSPTGESGYTPIQEPLTPKVAENHILGNHSVGVYPVRLDNTVNFLAFDLDVAKFAVKQAITSQRAWAGVMAKVHQAACRLLDIAAAQEIPAYLEDSGFKGRHVWIFLESPLPAGVAKKCGDLLASRLPPLPPEVTLEVFPKQATVRPGSLGNLIKLPLGIHRRTGQRGLFLQPDGQPFADQLGLLTQVAKAPRGLMHRTIQRLHAIKVAPAPAPPAEEMEPAPPPAAPLAAPEAPYHLEKDHQFQFLLTKCPTLRALAEKVNLTSQLTKEETLVLLHTVGHLEHGPQAVNEIFERTINADPSLFLKSRLRGNPMSCPKIRARIPHLTATVDCNCSFDLTSNLYPTPLIHAQALTPPAGPLGLTVDSLQFQNLLKDYLKLRQQLRETRLLLERYEAGLAQFFQEAGVESVETPMGRLRRVPTADGQASFTLEL
jgi:hypothetical protein